MESTPAAWRNGIMESWNRERQRGGMESWNRERQRGGIFKKIVTSKKKY